MTDTTDDSDSTGIQPVLQPKYLAGDPSDRDDLARGNPRSAPLVGTFYRASARVNHRKKPFEPVDKTPENRQVSVNLKGALGQKNFIFPYMTDWFTANPRRTWTLRAIGVAASIHGSGDFTGYYLSESGGDAYTLKRKIGKREGLQFDGGFSDRTLNDWAANRVPDGVIWIDESVVVVGGDG